ncbi:MAG: lipoate--protein ligase family protein [Desulfobacterales bacterium]|jgi:lipoate-protein ligase A|nr:lipoate--protein ligase family protein [Desulfobacterales bacterium]
MDLYNLGKVPWDDSQLIYHALADLGREGLILLSPASPYVCIGFHQNVEQEVDLAFCRQSGIPVFRREVGGGAVYLDGGQLFFQLVLRADNPLLPAAREAFYRKFLEPVVGIYRRLGIPAEYKPINDVVVGARKISGSGVGEIGAGVVFVGNLIVDFNHEMMARVLKVPDEKFRDKVHKTLVGNLATIRRELGDAAAAEWTEERLNALMIDAFASLLGPFETAAVDTELRSRADALRSRMLSDDWLVQRRGRGAGRDIRIRAGLHLLHRVHKARGGLLRADYELTEGRLSGVSISGDFFCYPPDAVRLLEAGLEGRRPQDVREVARNLSVRRAIEIPGVNEDDWAVLLA